MTFARLLGPFLRSFDAFSRGTPLLFEDAGATDHQSNRREAGRWFNLRLIPHPPSSQVPPELFQPAVCFVPQHRRYSLVDLAVVEAQAV